jgi:phosphoglycerol transferase MdoB-like AlkP superfamily enzyme
MLSLSSHEPFDVPFGKPDITDEQMLFLNSCRYADSCFGRFIDESKKKDWWKNTLVIITADHGHRNPGKSQVGESAKFRIPMLWIGGAVERASRINKMGSQLDIAATLLNQLKLNSEQFTFSKNLLNPETHSFAVYSFHNGFGYLDPGAEIVYDFDYKNYLMLDSTVKEESIMNAKAFMQTLFHDYNKR